MLAALALASNQAASFFIILNLIQGYSQHSSSCYLWQDLGARVPPTASPVLGMQASSSAAAVAAVADGIYWMLVLAGLGHRRLGGST